MSERRKCPYCAEEIPGEAVRCRFCRSRLTSLDPESWHRDLPERKLAGVAAAVSRAVTAPVGLVRVVFVVLSVFHFLGPMLYVALWLVVPFEPGEESVLGRSARKLVDVIEAFRGERPASSTR